MNNVSMSPIVFYQNQARLAEEHFQRGNLKGAIQIMNSLTFREPNTSSNHRAISQVLYAYQIHWRFQQEGFTHYDTLRLSSPYCSHQVIQIKYKNIVAKLCPERNVSVATKSAFVIVKNAWRVLSDRERRRDYNIEQGFESPIMFQEAGSDQVVRDGKRHYIEIISDSESDSNSD